MFAEKKKMCEGSAAKLSPCALSWKKNANFFFLATSYGVYASVSECAQFFLIQTDFWIFHVTL